MELYNYAKPGKPIDREETLDLTERSVIIVDGHYLDDPGILPEGWFDMEILIGRSYENIFRVRAARGKWLERASARVQWNEDVVFRPTWWKHVGRNHPEWTTGLVFDLDDFDHPKQLSYRHAPPGWVEQHRQETAALQSFAGRMADTAAAKLVELHQSAGRLTKLDQTTVTGADYAVQRMLMEAILREHPDHYVDAEEDLAGFYPDDAELEKLLRLNEGNRGKADYVWVMDPLDGTSEYARRGKGYSFALGILYLGQPFYAAILSPESGIRYEADAVRGVATRNGTELPLLQPREGKPRVVAHGSESRGIVHPHQDKIQQFAALAAKPTSIILTTSGIGGEGAEGVDAVSSVVTKTNDAIPPAILLTTLGGKAVRPDGAPLFPVTWRDLSVPDREMRVVAGVPAVVDRLVTILARREEVSASQVIAGWEGFSRADQERLRKQLGRLVDGGMLARLVRNAQDPVTPPRTLYELLAMALNRTEAEVQAMVESLPDESWQAPYTIPIGESQRLADPAQEETRELLERTVIVLAAGGGGARFKKDLPERLREQLERLGRLEKPTVMIGPSGTSPTVGALEGISELARRVGARGVRVMVVVGPDTTRAVRNDIQENGKWLDRRAIRMRVVEQATFPSFDPSTGKILTTQDPRGRPVLLRNSHGTYGAFLAAYQAVARLGVAEGRDWLILYGDDPRLNTGEFIAQSLHQRREHALDVAAVTTPKLIPSVPVGGTRADLVLPDGRRIPLIIEKAERTPDPEKGIAGLPAFNRVEAAETAKGRDPFGFNTGPVVFSERAARAIASATPLLRYADRDRDDLPGQKRRNLETFLTHGLTVAGALGMKVGDLQVDSHETQAAKEWPTLESGRQPIMNVVNAAAEMNRYSRRLLENLPGGDRVSIGEEARLSVRAPFKGFRIEGEGGLVLSGETGYVLSPEGLSRVPIVAWEEASWKEPDPEDPTQEVVRAARHPIFADPGQGELLLPANPDGTITLSDALSFSAGLEEGAVEAEERVREILSGLRRAEQGAGMVLVGPEALAGSEGLPALAPLLIALKDSRPAEEWEEIRGRVIAYVEDEALFQQMEAAGYPSAQWVSDLNRMLTSAPSSLTFYMAGEDWLKHGLIPAVTDTVQLSSENFLAQLARLLQLLGYIPPVPEELEPLADALYEAAQA